ncbi:DUF4062 domain-containing protein [Chryseobacterium gambrini]|uniref:DUF4062 domain-containing protein n=1 Tax=Chryseobacterium gambrini TaxID=373672 RepID=UPI0022F401CB|nr:DUF4062 domain-containing protein [Chryseobacterium gambrini]WBX96942.1 DUF4062 domain-containing protein [Chryseobacterium gambrini]
MNNLNIFVSSTCYDLSQLRANLYDFINSCGHNPFLSEYDNFPISTELNSIENCIKNVKDNADILVLIVGSRYGSIIENGKSITNTEFLTAKQKGIPIFCFIDKNTLNALNFWKNNKDGNFSNIVDNKQIFEFITDIRDNKKIWTFSFEKSQDIIQTLKIQLSYLFKNSLKVKNIIDRDISDFFKLNLSEKCLKILIEKNSFFEFEFLYQTLIDEIEKKEFLKNDIEYSILVEPKHFINNHFDLPTWAINRASSHINTITNLKGLTSMLQKFIGEYGEPSDIKGLYYASVKYAQIYEQLLNWIIDVKSTYMDPEFEDIKIHLSDLAMHTANELWNYPFNIKEKIVQAKHDELNGVENILDLNLTLTINEQAHDKLNELLEKLQIKFSKLKEVNP